jgi:hypothetical protein
MIERLWLDVLFEDKEAAKAAGRPLGRGRSAVVRPPASPARGGPLGRAGGDPAGGGRAGTRAPDQRVARVDSGEAALAFLRRQDPCPDAPQPGLIMADVYLPVAAYQESEDAIGGAPEYA